MIETEIQTAISYDGKILSIHLADKEGEPLKLNSTHEKLMHLIIVSENLKNFYHLHPVRINDLTFEVEHSLTNGTYKAFIDINPIGINYVIKPNQFRYILA